jgi:hypothetical protein
LALPDGGNTCDFGDAGGCNPIDAGKEAGPKDASHDGPKDGGASG